MDIRLLKENFDKFLEKETTGKNEKSNLEPRLKGKVKGIGNHYFDEEGKKLIAKYDEDSDIHRFVKEGQTNLLNDVVQFFESKGFTKKYGDFWTSKDGKDVRIQPTTFSQNKNNVEVKWGYWKQLPFDLFEELKQKFDITQGEIELDVSESRGDEMIMQGYRYIITGAKQMQEGEQDMHKAEIAFSELSTGNFLPKQEDSALVDRMVKDGMIDTDKDETYWFTDRGFEMIKSSKDLYNKYFVESGK